MSLLCRRPWIVNVVVVSRHRYNDTTMTTTRQRYVTTLLSRHCVVSWRWRHYYDVNILTMSTSSWRHFVLVIVDASSCKSSTSLRLLRYKDATMTSMLLRRRRRLVTSTSSRRWRLTTMDVTDDVHSRQTSDVVLCHCLPSSCRCKATRFQPPCPGVPTLCPGPASVPAIHVWRLFRQFRYVCPGVSVLASFPLFLSRCL